MDAGQPELYTAIGVMTGLDDKASMAAGMPDSWPPNDASDGSKVGSGNASDGSVSAKTFLYQNGMCVQDQHFVVRKLLERNTS